MRGISLGIARYGRLKHRRWRTSLVQHFRRLVESTRFANRNAARSGLVVRLAARGKRQHKRHGARRFHSFTGAYAMVQTITHR